MPASTNHTKSLFLFVVLFSVITHAGGSLSADKNSSLLQRYELERDVFLELNELLQAGNLNEARRRRNELNNYPLASYFNFLLLQQEIKSHDEPAELLAQAEQFKSEKGLHRRLLGAIKNRSAELGRWQDYKQATAGANSPVHPCDDLMAEFKTGEAVRISGPVSELWVDVDRHTNRCLEVFSALLGKIHDVPTGALWRRSVALIKRGDTEQANALLKYFNKRDRRVVKAWIDDRDKPEDLLRSDVMRGDSVHHQEIANFLLSRWARTDLPAATKFWRANGNRFGFSDKRVQEALAKYAVLAAKRGLPEASQLLSEVKPDRDVRYWLVRTALRNLDWKQSLVHLDGLTDSERSQPRWQYWRARSLEEQGFDSAAKKIYQNLAGKFEYYGFLAADRLSLEYSIAMDRPLVKEAELQALKQSDQIAQAIEFFLVDIPWEGRRRWNNELAEASNDRLFAAARIAQSVGWHDRALMAVLGTKEGGALDILFPTPYSEYVKRVASTYDVEREFVYAVMRQESRFITDIRSSAGAVGLMQLMPATARQMGKELGISVPRWKLIQGELNIKLGVKYLNHVLSRFDNNLVLAAAAYNAGPSRVKKWIADAPMDADVWVETIPFDETRDYVRAVLFNTVVSQWLLRDGASTRLEHRMPDLHPTG